MPLLSIVIPVYNAEKYLEDCVSSVLAQEFTDYEVILVDDGSSDSSPDICDRLSAREKRIQVIHQSNQGQAGARNRGIERAEGEYIGFCDNDDMLAPEIFKILIEQATAGKTDVSACSYQVKEASGKLTHASHSGQRYQWNRFEGMREFLSREKMDIYVWTKIYRREFLNNCNIRFEIGRSDEDFLFNHRVFIAATSTVFVDKGLYTYYVREASECRMLYRRNLKKYLRDTLYRTYRIENITARLFPDLLYLAKRQTIFYHVMMLGRITETGIQDCRRLWIYILRYLRSNYRQVVNERHYWSMSLPGVWLMMIIPPQLYYIYRRKMRKN
ncbi:glycosyltransferase [uncultured Odoribacter sp.]|uniref:glycosyltransferase n=1 Tax=uncultured Odoribacter sp. TaxID=876416 RepID=UPI002607BAEF|nr:glycosyltransferase [uncultured Odoribacter sp.]